MSFIEKSAPKSKGFIQSAMAAHLAEVFKTLRNLRDRQSLKATAARLSERQLRDIGLIKDDFADALNAPIFSDPSQVLGNKRRERAGNF